MVGRISFNEEEVLKRKKRLKSTRALVFEIDINYFDIHINHTNEASNGQLFYPLLHTVALVIKRRGADCLGYVIDSQDNRCIYLAPPLKKLTNDRRKSIV